MSRTIVLRNRLTILWWVYTSQTTQLLLGQELHWQRWQPLINESRGQVGSIPASYYKGTVSERRQGDWIFWKRLFMCFLSPYTQNRPIYIELSQTASFHNLPHSLFIDQSIILTHE
jgi:hypothetical protein